MAMQVGDSKTVEVMVDEHNVAGAVGSGLVKVFSTPAMITEMEKAAALLMGESLPEGQSSVGAHVNVAHSAATPIGMKVYTTATITKVDGRRVDFDVVSRDDEEEVGRGTHTRFVIDFDKFMKRVAEKTEKAGG